MLDARRRPSPLIDAGTLETSPPAADQFDGSWQVNSIGSVYGAGRHYLIAVMTVGNPSWDYGIDTIEKISRAVWGDLSPAHS